MLEGGCRSEREDEEESARGLLRWCFSCQPAINGMDRAVACACQGCRWHFCHGCDWHLPYCSTHCTFSVLYDALNEGRNMESGKNVETGRNGGGSRTVLRNPSPTQVMGLWPFPMSPVKRKIQPSVRKRRKEWGGRERPRGCLRVLALALARRVGVNCCVSSELYRCLYVKL